MTIEEAQQRATAFRDERDWAQFYNPKDLAISISLEASELLEVFQWSGDDLECASKRDRIKEDLADVLIYCALLADRLNLNPADIMADKIQANATKYPVSKSRSSAAKYTEM